MYFFMLIPIIDFFRTQSQSEEYDDAKTLLQQLVASLQREPSESKIKSREWMEEREEMEKRVYQIQTQLEREREVVEQLIQENRSLNESLGTRKFPDIFSSVFLFSTVFFTAPPTFLT